MIAVDSLNFILDVCFEEEILLESPERPAVDRYLCHDLRKCVPRIRVVITLLCYAQFATTNNMRSLLHESSTYNGQGHAIFVTSGRLHVCNLGITAQKASFAQNFFHVFIAFGLLLDKDRNIRQIIFLKVWAFHKALMLAAAAETTATAMLSNSISISIITIMDDPNSSNNNKITPPVSHQ